MKNPINQGQNNQESIIKTFNNTAIGIESRTIKLSVPALRALADLNQELKEILENMLTNQLRLNPTESWSEDDHEEYAKLRDAHPVHKTIMFLGKLTYEIETTQDVNDALFSK